MFTAMGMCWSGFLSTHTAMLDALGYRHLTSRAIVAHTIGGLCAGWPRTSSICCWAEQSQIRIQKEAFRSLFAFLPAGSVHGYTNHPCGVMPCTFNQNRS